MDFPSGTVELMYLEDNNGMMKLGRLFVAAIGLCLSYRRVPWNPCG